MALSPLTTFSGQKLEPAFRADLAPEIAGQFPPGTSLARGTVVGEYSAAAANEVQSLAITGSPTGGTFRLTFNGQTTTALNHNSSAAAVQAALEALSTIGTGNVVCTGGALPGTAVTITFVKDLGNRNVAAITTTDSLTGGSSPASAITTSTAGSGGPGTYGAYDNSASNGLEVARGILAYDIYVDYAGRITFGNEADSGPFATRYQNAPIFVAGYFKCEDLIGLDSNAVTDLGRLVRGTTSSGILSVK